MVLQALVLLVLTSPPVVPAANLAQAQRGMIWFDILLALGLSGLIATLSAALLQLAAATYQQSNNDQYLQTRLSSAWSSLAYYLNLAQALAPAASSANSSAGLGVSYTHAVDNPRSHSDCALNSSNYSSGSVISNSFTAVALDDGWQLQCQAASKQSLVPGIANMGLMYGIDSGSWGASGQAFIIGAYDRKADFYLSPQNLQASDRIVSVKIAWLAASYPSQRQTPSPERNYAGSALPALAIPDTASVRSRIMLMSYALPNIEQ